MDPDAYSEQLSAKRREQARFDAFSQALKEINISPSIPFALNVALLTQQFDMCPSDVVVAMYTRLDGNIISQFQDNLPAPDTLRSVSVPNALIKLSHQSLISQIATQKKLIEDLSMSKIVHPTHWLSRLATAVTILKQMTQAFLAGLSDTTFELEPGEVIPDPSTLTPGELIVCFPSHILDMLPLSHPENQEGLCRMIIQALADERRLRRTLDTHTLS
jgi:hypothetical protein